jgi:hypothetical protein
MAVTEEKTGSGHIGDRIDPRSKFSAASLLFAALLTALPGVASTPVPISLALFDFELEDFSAGGPSAGGTTPSDIEQLTRVTDEVRQLFAQSGRYRLIDVGAADAAPAKAHTLRDCDGCDAAIALKLGAEQSFLGIVKRISRTEYVVRFQIRDARTGATVSEANSGLRMGADYSWARGAVRLIEDRLPGIQKQ